MTENDSTRIWLSTDGYYFVIRPDKHDNNIERATLYNSEGDAVDDIRKSAGYGLPEKSIHDLINYFEARITLGQIK